MPGYNQKPVQQKNLNGKPAAQRPLSQPQRPSGPVQHKTNPPQQKNSFNQTPKAPLPAVPAKTPDTARIKKPALPNMTRPAPTAQKPPTSTRVPAPAPPQQQRPNPTPKPPAQPAVKLNLPNNTPKLSPKAGITPRPSTSNGVKLNNHPSSSKSSLKPHNGSNSSSRSSKSYAAQQPQSNTKTYLMIGIPAGILLIVGIIALATSGDGKKQTPAVSASDNDSNVKPSDTPAGAKERFREMTDDWKKKLAEAETHIIEADKIMENAEDSDRSVEERLGYFDDAEKEYRTAIDIYESFCMEYSGCYQFGYDDKYDKACSKNKKLKFNKNSLKERSKHNND